MMTDVEMTDDEAREQIERGERFGEEPDVALTVLRHAELHPRPGAPALREDGLQPGRARLVADAGEHGRAHVVGVLGLFELPHLVREFDGDAALTVVLYNEHKVRANFAFTTQELNDQALAAVLKGVDKFTSK